MEPFAEEKEEKADGLGRKEEWDNFRPQNREFDDLESNERLWEDGYLGISLWSKVGREWIGTEREAIENGNQNGQI